MHMKISLELSFSVEDGRFSFYFFGKYDSWLEALPGDILNLIVSERLGSSLILGYNLPLGEKKRHSMCELIQAVEGQGPAYISSNHNSWYHYMSN